MSTLAPKSPGAQGWFGARASHTRSPTSTEEHAVESGAAVAEPAGASPVSNTSAGLRGRYALAYARSTLQN
jgi:hypothetical protein